jgi:hypothetical protein
VTDAIDWAIEAAANVAKERGGPYYTAKLIGRDGSVMALSMVAHGAQSILFLVSRADTAKEVRMGDMVFPVDPQALNGTETIKYRLHWPS